MLYPNSGTIWHRICVITGLRIGFLDRVNDPDVTYNWAILFLFCALEALLGITLACLPVLPPVTGKLADSQAFSWSRQLFRSGFSTGSKPSKLSERSSKSGSGLPRKDKMNFRRLAENSFPTSIDTETHALHDIEAQDLFTGEGPANNIRVTKAWDVQSTQHK